MASEVGEIEVVLRARIEKLNADLRKAEAKTKKTANGMAASFKRVAAAVSMIKTSIVSLVAVVGGVGVYAFLNLSKQAIKTANDIGDVSEKLGVSTSALQEFQFAASQSGVKVETLNMGLQRFGRRSAEAAQGTGEAKDAIKQLGVQLRDTDGKLRTTEALFTDAMAAIGDVQDPLEQLRLGFKLFDSEGAGLIVMAANLEDLRGEARRLGLVLSDDVIQRSDELQDRFDALATVTQNQLTPALVDLGGRALLSTLETMAELATWANKVYRHFADIKNLGLANAEAKLDEVRAKLVKDTEALANAEARRTSPRNKLALQNRVKAGEEEVDLLEAQIKLLSKKREVEGGGVAGTGNKFRTEAEEQKIESDRLKAIEQRKRLAAEAHSEWLAASGQRIRAIEEELVLDIAALTTKLQANEDYSAAVDKLEKTAAINIAKIRAEDVAAVEDGLDDEKDMYAELFQFMEDGFADSMASMLLDGEFTFKALAESFLREFIQKGIGKLVGDAFDAFATSRTYGVTGGLIGPAQKANGGPISGATLVGERGPELFIPGTSGFVANNLSLQRMAGGSGGGGVNVTVINNSGEEATTTERDGPGGSRSIEVMIGKAISKNIARGGDVDQAIRNSYGVNRIGRHGI